MALYTNTTELNPTQTESIQPNSIQLNLTQQI